MLSLFSGGTPIRVETFEVSLEKWDREKTGKFSMVFSSFALISVFGVINR